MSGGLITITAADILNSRWYLGHLISLLLTGGDTQGRLSAVAVYGREKFEPPVHVHTRDSTLMLSLDGHISAVANGQVGDLEEMGISVMPRWSEQSFKTRAPEFRSLLLFSPAGMEEYFRFMSVPAERMELPPPADITELFNQIDEAGRRYGLIWTAYGEPHPSPSENTGKLLFSNPPSGWQERPVVRLADGFRTDGIWDAWILNLEPGQQAEVGSPASGITAVYLTEGCVGVEGCGTSSTLLNYGMFKVADGAVAAVSGAATGTSRMLVVATPADSSPDPAIVQQLPRTEKSDSSYGFGGDSGSSMFSGR